MRNQVLDDIVKAMKNKDKETLSTLRLLKGAMQLEEINKKRELNDEEMIGIISKQIKTRRESITEFEKASRRALVEKTAKEISILEKYMPEQLSSNEVDKIIDDVFEQVKPQNMKDMKLLMNELNPKLKGKTDMSSVSKKVKDKLTKIIGE